MEIIWILMGLPLVAGVVIAVMEKRRNKIFLKHDFNLLGPATEADRDGERAKQAILEAHQRSLM